MFSAKIYSQAITYRASGRGALGYRKFAKVFSAKIYFQAIRGKFFPAKETRYMWYVLLHVLIESAIAAIHSEVKLGPEFVSTCMAHYVDTGTRG